MLEDDPELMPGFVSSTTAVVAALSPDCEDDEVECNNAGSIVFST